MLRTAPAFHTAALHARWVASHVEVQTPDGWRLPVHRLRPLEPTSEVPVLLVHGHGTSSWTFFAGAHGGLAGTLADAGRDVFTVDLRGARHARYSGSRPVVQIRDKLAIDLPAAIEYVTREAGCDVVDGVGHSMGGILLSLHALYARHSGLRRLVTIGSPLVIDKQVLPSAIRVPVLQRTVAKLGRIPMGGLVRTLAGQLDARVMPTHFTAESVDDETLRDLFAHGVTDVFGPELAEMARWITAADHRELLPAALRDRAPRLGTPTRFLVGAADGLTTPKAVLRTFDAIGGSECEYLELGLHTGFRRDYRHLDVLIGRDAGRDVAPLVAEWLSGAAATRHHPARRRKRTAAAV